MVTNEDYFRLREKIGTQEYAAQLLGVTSRTIQRRESGDLPVSKEAYLAIMALLETNEARRPSYEDDLKAHIRFPYFSYEELKPVRDSDAEDLPFKYPVREGRAVYRPLGVTTEFQDWAESLD